MIKKIAIIGVASVLLALAAPMAVLANRPPPSPFGGGERAIHINENANGTAQGGTHHTNTHTSMVSQSYEYGAFLGTLTVERLGRTVRIYGGATMEAMDFGAGHFSFTGLHYGNVGLIGHNRGARNGFFSFVRLLQYGDIVRLDVGGGVRTFEVFMKIIVYETDFSPLQQFGDNRLTLVTCVEYVRNQRRVVSLIEI
jgi:LPXTG-site transpeptidase (sortase) family protein